MIFLPFLYFQNNKRVAIEQCENYIYFSNGQNGYIWKSVNKEL